MKHLQDFKLHVWKKGIEYAEKANKTQCETSAAMAITCFAGYNTICDAMKNNAEHGAEHQDNPGRHNPAHAASGVFDK
jgi:hypothetical protein